MVLRRYCTAVITVFFHSFLLLPEASPTIHMTMMAVLARPVVDLNFSGWQMAYQRSMEIDVSVITETVTETVCEHVRKKT